MIDYLILAEKPLAVKNFIVALGGDIMRAII